MQVGELILQFLDLQTIVLNLIRANQQEMILSFELNHHLKSPDYQTLEDFLEFVQCPGEVGVVEIIWSILICHPHLLHMAVSHLSLTHSV